MEWFEPLIIIAVILFVGSIFYFHFRGEFRSAKRAAKSGKCSCKCCSCNHTCSMKK